MSNSKLVNYTLISPNRTSPRSDAIRKITVHHMAGDLTVERCGIVFQTRQASANYGIGSDGRVGLYVEERDRSWASSSPENDNQAVTIEVANCGGEPLWPVSDLAYAKLIDLCVDICQRNGIEHLNFTGDESGNLTMHRYFAATLCPGPYLAERFAQIAAEVNTRLEKVRAADNAEMESSDNKGEYIIDTREFISQFTDEQCYEIVAKAQTYAGTLPVSGWAVEKFAQARADGITDGTRPAAFITREEAAIMADRAKGGQAL